ncbi:hypothetical protein MBLNU459_g8472t1 [Dothideomycetes sp. NU459]
MAAAAMDLPLSPLLDPRQTMDSLVSVPLSDSVRLSSVRLSLAPTLHEIDTGANIAHQDGDEYMASLLARLEMENDALATDPKAGISRSFSATQHDGLPQDAAPRSSLSVYIPKEALGMSLGDFWALVTKDYSEALAVMPTMTPIMIHKGVPDFLRPVVWVGLARARDEKLHHDFDCLVERLQHEHPNSEGIIDKDLGRCFPHHDLFMHPDGEGQRMLGQVLKCYNLYDPEVGYCQGMGFVVGVLLMKMEARDAFCVFVKLMENHGLRDVYSKSLSGLHSRIFQFQQLLSPLAPNLLAHFKNLGVEFAYLSQWFMTIFATTCPLNTLFRIYDIILAEGANETIMKVALAIILRNERTLLDMAELEDVLQFLLSRDIWSPYDLNPDQLVEEVTSLFGEVVTREALDKLDTQFETQSESDTADKTVRALGFTSSHFSAFKIFDNWWSPSKSTSTSPEAALRRAASKQSLATLNSLSAGSGSDSLASTDSYASTAPTEVDDPERDSATPTKLHRSIRQEDRTLHEQVEGLLVALSEVQREAAQTAADLQQEQVRRTKAQDIVGDLVRLFHQKKTVDAYSRQRRTTLPSRIKGSKTQEEMKELMRKSNFVKTVTKSVITGGSSSDADAGLQASLLQLCALFDAEQSLSQEVFESTERQVRASAQSAPNEDTLKLQEELAQLRRRMLKDRSRRHMRKTVELKTSRHSVETKSPEPARMRRALYRRKEIEKAVSRRVSGPPPEQDITVPRVRARKDTTPSDTQTTRPSRPRMIRLQDGSETSAPQKFSKRTSSLVARDVFATTDNRPPPDETLLVELVSAKTREATAIHERDEMKVQLDKTRRIYEAREAEMKARLESMETIMLAQIQAHAAELEKVKGNISMPGTPASLSHSPLGTPEIIVPPSKGGWGWFTKGRSVSTGGMS